MGKRDKGILSTIGHTPLIRLDKVFADYHLNLHAKLEMFNPGGSIKDRPAAEIIGKAMDNCNLTRGDTVIESSSGNMAIGLAQMCRFYGLNLIIVVDPRINSHTLTILETYGSRIEQVTTPDENGNYLSARLNRVNELLDKIPGSFWPNQYANVANPSAHHQTMAEILEHMPQPPQYLFASVSTCGTIMGCSEYLREYSPTTKVVAVDAVGSIIFGASAGDRLVPGHGAGRSPELLNKDLIDRVVYVNDLECINGCHQLLNTEAILTGGSSGAVLAAVKKLNAQLPENADCVLILPDSGERYLDTIYNNDWLNSHFGDKVFSGAKNGSITVDKITENTDTDSKFTEPDNKRSVQKVAIIGGGPKGMYGFERLAAQFNAQPVDHDVEIHVYDKSAHFGAGDIYNPTQPDYLLINNPIGDIDMWLEESPPPVVPEALPLTEWLKKKRDLSVSKQDYIGRSLVGQYLIDGFKGIAEHLPPDVSGSYIAGEVTDIFKQNDGYRLKLKMASGNTLAMPHIYDQVLLATGHPKNELTKTEKQYQLFAESLNKIEFVPFVYPVESNLKGIAPNSTVAIKGIGLTFIDAVLALTEGRGGTFDRFNDNQLRYVPSGNEPETIYPFSRSGLPMIPRPPAPENPTRLKFCTKESLSHLRNESPGSRIDFHTQVKPLLYQEMIFSFYDIQLKASNFKSDLNACISFQEVQHHIELFHKSHSDVEQFDPELFLNPLNEKHFKSRGSFNEKIACYLRFFIKEARIGELESPWAAAVGVWRKITPIFSEIYSFGGLLPDSQFKFDTDFRRLLNRVSFGPPMESGAKIVALIEAGILNFNLAQNPAVTTCSNKKAFLLHCKSQNSSQNVSGLIDARIPKTSIDKNRSKLYKNLKRRGLIKKFTNEYDGKSYQPGCAAISPDGFTINEAGKIDPDLAMYGTVTEGVTFDNDALSRTRNNFVSGWAEHVRNSFPLKYVEYQTL